MYFKVGRWHSHKTMNGTSRHHTQTLSWIEFGMTCARIGGTPRGSKGLNGSPVCRQVSPSRLNACVAMVSLTVPTWPHNAPKLLRRLISSFRYPDHPTNREAHLFPLKQRR